jgi:hypothetical protein
MSRGIPTISAERRHDGESGVHREAAAVDPKAATYHGPLHREAGIVVVTIVAICVEGRRARC